MRTSDERDREGRSEQGKQEWVKPQLEVVPMKDAMASASNPLTVDGAGAYS